MNAVSSRAKTLGDANVTNDIEFCVVHAAWPSQRDEMLVEIGHLKTHPLQRSGMLLGSEQHCAPTERWNLWERFY